MEIKRARREAGVSQSELAREVGCKQSALSMFESGDPTKLNDEVVEKLAKKFGISLADESAEKGAAESTVGVLTAGERGFCSNPQCPSNHRYLVGEQVFLEPDRLAADPVCGKFCAKCGEVLEKRCPNCGAHLHDGAVCSYCGKPYIEL